MRAEKSPIYNPPDALAYFAPALLADFQQGNLQRLSDFDRAYEWAANRAFAEAYMRQEAKLSPRRG